MLVNIFALMIVWLTELQLTVLPSSRRVSYYIWLALEKSKFNNHRTVSTECVSVCTIVKSKIVNHGKSGAICILTGLFVCTASWLSTLPYPELCHVLGMDTWLND